MTAAAHHKRRRFFGLRIAVDQPALFIIGVYAEIYIIGVDNPVFSEILADLAVRIIQIGFEIGQIIFHNAGRKPLAGFQFPIVREDPVFLLLLSAAFFLHFSHNLVVQSHDAGKIYGLIADRYRIRSHGFLLHVGNVVVHPCRKGQNQSDTDNPYRPGKSGQQGSALLGPQVVKREGQSR